MHQKQTSKIFKNTIKQDMPGGLTGSLADKSCGFVATNDKGVSLIKDLNSF